ncbi:MAG: hypothetical protein OXH68_00860 [Gammaproteobacteria bacterium]|nr:hypothetical protein [Gammaproteobacteria bacterium]
MGIAAICTTLCSCGWLGNPEAEAAFVDSLRTVIRGQSDISQFDLAETTSFDWSTAHVFRPYTSEKAVNEAIGKRIYSRSLHLRDDINLLVFTENGEVVLTVEVPLGVCDFAYPAEDRWKASNTNYRVANGSALFRVVIDDTGYCVAKPLDVLPD